MTCAAARRPAASPSAPLFDSRPDSRLRDQGGGRCAARRERILSASNREPARPRRLARFLLSKAEMALETPFQRILTTSAVATAATTVATAALGRMQCGSAAAPLNATSHIIWGEDAKRRDAADYSHTLVGGLLNAAAMVSWVGVQHLLFPRPRGLWGSVATGVAVSALAYITDYHVVPKRFTPGFEARLSRGGLLAMYATLAAALAATASAKARR